jgi:hypothetical protein
MKKTLTILAVLAISFGSLAAQSKRPAAKSNNDDRLHSYLGLGSGMNNISSAFGLTFEQPFSKNVSAKIGAGVGLWGYKFGFSGRFYREYAKSWAFGVGYSTASGVGEFETELETTTSGAGNTEIVKMKLGRAHAIDLTASRGWGNKVKFNLELGYSVAVNSTPFTVTNNKQLTDIGQTVLKWFAPGGLIVGIGVSFRL